MSVVLLADVKAYGNFQADVDNQALQATIDAAEAIVANYVGPLASTTVTQRFYNVALSAVLSLSTTPVISVTSVTGTDGSVVPLANLDIDLSTGTIYPDTTGWINRFMLNRYTVVYQAGWSTVPNDIKFGIMELSSYLWKPRRGPTRGNDIMPEPPNFILPNRVRGYLDPYIPLGIG